MQENKFTWRDDDIQVSGQPAGGELDELGAALETIRAALLLLDRGVAAQPARVPLRDRAG